MIANMYVSADGTTAGVLSARENTFINSFSFSEIAGEALCMGTREEGVWIESK